MWCFEESRFVVLVCVYPFLLVKLVSWFALSVKFIKTDKAMQNYKKTPDRAISHGHLTKI